MNLFDRAKQILISPKTEWDIIKGEETTIQDIFMKYVVILAAIPAVAGFVGFSVFGMSYGLGSYHIPVGTGLLWAISTYIFSLIAVYVFAFVIDALAPSFGSSKDLTTSMKVVAYSYTASWVGGIFQIFPALGIIAMFAGIYSLYLLYIGLRNLKEVPQEKMIGYYIVSLIVGIVLFMIIGAITSSIAFGGYMFSSAMMR
ncbi:MAG: YIP1 family protein [Chlorobi bacterium]|nr:YIP1 family protein [Chlorobiota bacterium]